MADKTDAWMPLWIGAYLADTMKLTTVQHGAYFLLLISYWRERAPLVDDDEELRSITKTDKSEWKRLRPVMSKFFRVGDGVWWHKRVEAEIAAADERSKKSSEKAKKAAEARWGDKGKHPPSNAPSMPQALPEHMPDECPTPSPINTSSVDEVSLPTPGEACKAMRAAGMSQVSPSNPTLIALLEAGITVAELADAAADAVERGKPFAYALVVAENRRREAAAIKPLPAAGSAPRGNNKHAAAAAAIFDMEPTGAFNA